MVSNFSLAPTLTIDGIIDFTTNEGHKHFKRATEPLSDKEFGLNPED